MRKQSALLFGICCGLFASQGCGEMGEGDATEAVRAELGSFGSWASAGGILRDCPALVKGPNTTLTAFGQGTDNLIYTTAQNSSGQWTGSWTPLPPLPGGNVPSPPAAVALDVSSGNLVNHFLIVAQGLNDHDYYVRIQNQSGSSVLQDWQKIGSGRDFISPPALAFAPAGPFTGPNPVIMLAGRTSTNNTTIIVLKNTLTNNQYFNNAWRGTSQANLPARGTPALAFVPRFFTGADYFVMAAGTGQPDNITYKISWFHAGSWGEWQNVPNGTFKSNPAVAAGTQGPSFGSEITLYGLGLDNRVWVTNRIPNGSFSPIGSVTFGNNPNGNNPTAMGVGNVVTVSALSGGVPFTNSANSPF